MNSSMNHRFLALVLWFGLIFVASVEANRLSKEDCKCENLKDVDYRIVNGTSGPQLEQGLPWIGFFALRIEESRDFGMICTAFVIGRRWALTGKIRIAVRLLSCIQSGVFLNNTLLILLE